MFFKYVNSDCQPAVFGPICKVRTPHLPGSDAHSSRISFQDEQLARPRWRNDGDTIETLPPKSGQGR